MHIRLSHNFYNFGENKIVKAFDTILSSTTDKLLFNINMKIMSVVLDHVTLKVLALSFSPNL